MQGLEKRQYASYFKLNADAHADNCRRNSDVLQGEKNITKLKKSQKTSVQSEEIMLKLSLISTFSQESIKSQVRSQ